MSPPTALAALVLLLAALAVRGQQQERLEITSLTLGELTKDVADGQTPSFVDIKPSAGVLGDSYQVRLAILNSGKQQLEVQDVSIALYSGNYNDTVPDDAQSLPLDSTGVSALQSWCSRLLRDVGI